MIEVTHQQLDPSKILAGVGTPEAGALVLFLGTTRRITEGRQTAYLEYEAYETMARAHLEKLEHQACQRWPITRLAIVHRLGRVELAEASVAVAVSTPHRQDAFEAARWLIDSVKEFVPIWKQEHRPDGKSEWIHPGLDHLERS